MANFNLGANPRKVNYRMYMDRDLSTLDFNRRVLRLTENSDMDLRDRFKFIKIVFDNLDEYISVRLPELKGGTRSIALAELEDLYAEMGTKLEHIIIDSGGLSFSVSIFKDADNILSTNHLSCQRDTNSIPLIKDKSILSFTFNDNIPPHVPYCKEKLMRFLSRKSLKYIYTGGTVDTVIDEMTAIANIKDNMHPDTVLVSVDRYTATNRMDYENISELYDICKNYFNIPTPTFIKVPRLVLLIDHLDTDVLFKDIVPKSSGLSLYDEEDDEEDDFVNGYIGEEVINLIKDRDILINNPMPSSYSQVVIFIKAVCDSPDFQEIYISLYRVQPDGEIIKSLCRASKEFGKKVWVYIEPTARGNEMINIEIIKLLREAGVHVSCCYNSYKVHAKMCIALDYHGNILTHVGTGNYNEKTASLYTDLHLLTADKGIGATALSVFRTLFLSEPGPFTETYVKSDKLFVAPIAIREKLNELIDREIEKGPRGYICIKCNSLCDTAIIDKLYKASDMGVRIRLIVRTSIGLFPTDNIEIKSKVGKYLEHERFFIFGIDPDAEVYISSADLLQRNLDKRIECMTKIQDLHHRCYLMDKFHDEWNSDIDRIE